MLETKATQKGVPVKKDRIWSIIAKSFNDRTSAQIQLSWKNLKAKVIKKERDRVNDLKRTGGGPAKTIHFEEYEQKALSIISYASPLAGVNDSNSQVVNSSVESKESRGNRPANKDAATRIQLEVIIGHQRNPSQIQPLERTG